MIRLRFCILRRETNDLSLPNWLLDNQLPCVTFNFLMVMACKTETNNVTSASSRPSGYDLLVPWDHPLRWHRARQSATTVASIVHHLVQGTISQTRSFRPMALPLLGSRWILPIFRCTIYPLGVVLWFPGLAATGVQLWLSWSEYLPSYIVNFQAVRTPESILRKSVGCDIYHGYVCAIPRFIQGISGICHPTNPLFSGTCRKRGNDERILLPR